MNALDTHFTRSPRTNPWLRWKTGEAMDADALSAVVAERESHGLDTPVLVGSGVRSDTVAEVLSVADGAIVGTALKAGGETTAPVDQERVAALVSRADDAR